MVTLTLYLLLGYNSFQFIPFFPTFPVWHYVRESKQEFCFYT